MQLLDLNYDVFSLVLEQLYRKRKELNDKLFSTLMHHYYYARRRKMYNTWDSNAIFNLFLPNYSKSYYYEPKMQLIHWRMSRNNLIKALEDNQVQGDLIVSKCNRKFIANYLFSQGITHLFC